MILALAVALGLLVALVRHRGRIFDHIATIPLRWAWLAILALVLQWPLLRAQEGPVQSVRVQQALFLLSHVLLLIFVWRNRRVTGIQVIGLGVICNLLVIIANGGWMPITPETLTQINPGATLGRWQTGLHYGYSKDIILLREEARFWALSDILVIQRPFPRPTALSFGDLLIALGIIVLFSSPGAQHTSGTPESSSR